MSACPSPSWDEQSFPSALPLTCCAGKKLPCPGQSGSATWCTPHSSLPRPLSLSSSSPAVSSPYSWHVPNSSEQWITGRRWTYFFSQYHPAHAQICMGNVFVCRYIIILELFITVNVVELLKALYQSLHWIYSAAVCAWSASITVWCFACRTRSRLTVLCTVN